jgi:acetyl esterase
MNWKVKLVLAFAKFQKPLGDATDTDIKSMRKKAEQAVKIGSFLYDSKQKVYSAANKSINGIGCRIYKPSDKNNLPVMIYYHGGGFVLYGLDSHDLVCRRLCNMNQCIVVSVDYRLAPEHTFPAAHLDAWSVLSWVVENVAELGGNASKIILAGDSAGANLAACMAHKAKEQKLTIAAQVLVYPWVDGKLSNPSISRNGEGYMLTKEKMFWFQEKYTPNVDERCHPDVSPIYKENFEGLAPAIVITAEYDPLIDDGVAYYKKLVAASVPAEYKEYKGLIHGFFNLPKVAPEAIRAYEDIRKFLSGEIR